MSMSEADVAKNQADLDWWMKAFGDTVYGWTYRNSATVRINGERLEVTAKTRAFFMAIGGAAKVKEALDALGR